jgi:hypothetical protein
MLNGATHPLSRSTAVQAFFVGFENGPCTFQSLLSDMKMRAIVHYQRHLLFQRNCGGKAFVQRCSYTEGWRMHAFEALFKSHLLTRSLLYIRLSVKFGNGV